MEHTPFYDAGRHLSGGFASTMNLHPPAMEAAPRHHGRVIVLDRRNLLRDCVTHVLHSFAPDLEIVSIATLDEIAGSNALLILFGHGCAASSLPKLQAFVAQLKLRFPDAATVAIMANDDPQSLLDAIESGVSGVLPMNTNIRVALAAIELILAGGTFAPCNALAQALHHETHDLETQVQERQVQERQVQERQIQERQVQERQIQESQVYRTTSRVVPLYAEMATASCFHTASTDLGAIPAIQLVPNHTSSLPEAAHIFTLREQQVLERLKNGTQNKLIAYSLGIAESTVKVHLRNIMKKLHATNRTQVAFMTKDLHAEIAMRIERDEGQLAISNTA